MSSDEGWEEVYKDDTNIIIDIKERLKRKDIKLELLYTLIKIFKEFYTHIDIPKIQEYIDFNIIQKMYQMLRSEDQKNTNYYFKDYAQNIKYFKYLNQHKIFSRIYFVIQDKKVESFLEIYVNNVIIKNNDKYKGCIFYIDSDMCIEDYTYYFSNNMKNHTLFLEVFNYFKKYNFNNNNNYNAYNNDNISNNNDNNNKINQDVNNTNQEFKKLDLKRNKEIPSSYLKIKKHPLYCLESLLRYNQIIKKKDIMGFFKGEPVLLKENIINLKSDKYYYKKGKVPKKNEICHKIHNDIKYYSDDQVEDIFLINMNNKNIQDYLHENHIPKNCIYLQNEYDELICKKLKFEYRKCFIGFNKSNPIYKGIFIYKKDLFLVSNFLFEYYDYYWKIEIKNKILQIINRWEKIVKLCKKYTKLKDRI